MSFKSDLRSITGVLITDEYIRYARDEKGVKHATIASTLRALRSFLNWAKREGVIKDNPMDGIPITKPPSSDIETFTREQIRQLFMQPDLETFVGYRDYAIMTVLLETGVRVRELTDIKVSDVRMADSQILIAGKNREKRLVPFQAKTKAILSRYLAARGDSPIDYLFVTHDDNKMNRDSVRDRIAKYGRMAGIENVRCSPHTFRHTFAKMSVIGGADMFSLQYILGHKSLEMVKTYVTMFSGDVANSHRKFSPVENLTRLD